ncbi:MAG: hypothetical protein PWQ67_424 [Clostridia bacterium]|jgi:protein-disulfide isomerase-like protein with CxxC motif|nr:hypothetical protein [Clostridia bacterium]MDN5321970.1 hypothetical protein [Clostridia bacterium]
MAYKLDFAIKKFIHDLNQKIQEAKETGKSQDYLEGLNNALKIMLDTEECIGKLN